MTIGKRIKERRKELGISQVELARNVGLKQPTISDLESGNTRATTAIAQFANALKVNALWLETGKGAKDPLILDRNVEPAPSHNNFVPLVSWVKAGNWETPLDNRDKYDMVHCPVEDCSEDTYALTVRGISMDDPGNPKSFQEGDIIFVDPSREAISGSFVIAMHNDNYDATFKQLFIEDGKKFLRALNPNWEPKIQEINSETYICGVVIARTKTTKYC